MAIDRELEGVLSTAPLGGDKPGGTNPATDYTKSGGRWVLINVVCVNGGVGIGIYRSTVLAPNRYDRLPPHAGRQIHLVGQGFFAHVGVADIDSDVEVDVALPGIGL